MPFTKGLDVIQQAQSGTGKTATFCAGILHQVRTRDPKSKGRAVGDTLEVTAFHTLKHTGFLPAGVCSHLR